MNGYAWNFRWHRFSCPPSDVGAADERRSISGDVYRFATKGTHSSAPEERER